MSIIDIVDMLGRHDSSGAGARARRTRRPSVSADSDDPQPEGSASTPHRSIQTSVSFAPGRSIFQRLMRDARVVGLTPS
ncbi:MAG: hypothetical protein WBR56_15605, partial [Sedimenticolaceae bacterium]